MGLCGPVLEMWESVTVQARGTVGSTQILLNGAIYAMTCGISARGGISPTQQVLLFNPLVWLGKKRCEVRTEEN